MVAQIRDENKNRLAELLDHLAHWKFDWSSFRTRTYRNSNSNTSIDINYLTENKKTYWIGEPANLCIMPLNVAKRETLHRFIPSQPFSLGKASCLPNLDGNTPPGLGWPGLHAWEVHLRRRISRSISLLWRPMDYICAHTQPKRCK